MGKTYTGIDIGNNSLKMVVSDGTAIKNIAAETLPEGLVVEDRIVSFDAMADFVKEMASRMGGAAKDVAVILPPSITLTRRLSMPRMTEKELEINLPYEFRDFIQQGKDKYNFDYAVLGTKPAEGDIPETMDLMAVATQKKVVEDYTEMFKRAGKRLRIALPHAAALQNLVGGNPRALANCCVVDFSHESTKLHFFANGTYDVTRVIETGGIDADRAIANAMGVDIHIANSYKHTNFEGVIESSEVQNVCETIAVEIGRAINFYSFNNPDSTVDVLYCCGGGSLVPEVLKAVNAHVEIELQEISVIMPSAEYPRELLLQSAAAFGATLTG